MSLPVASVSAGAERRSALKIRLPLLMAALLSWAGAVHAEPIPDCSGEDGVLAVDNSQVLEWKSSTQNQFQARANVQGPISRLFDDRNGHVHFEIALGNGPGQVLEVVYNMAFGAMPQLQRGMMVQACGDYITSIAQSGPYPPSPSGAIIHWVHYNPRGSGHPHGFVVVENNLYGFNWDAVSGGRPKNGRGRSAAEPYFFPAPFGGFPSNAGQSVFSE